MATRIKPNHFSESGLATVAIIGAALGVIFGFGVGLALLSDNYYDLGLYFVLFSVFHSWEFIYVSLFHPEELTANSFLLNWGTQYYIAVGTTVVEYFLESWLFGWKGSFLFVFVGFLVALAGQAIRTVSMITAGSNFSHTIEEDKRDDHKLVTFGIYQYLRHPSYFGWFWWAISVQVMLTNPIALIGSFYACWVFFSDRIAFEEKTLLQQFGRDYERYRTITPVGIPFIK